jgi:hypothetical protein
LAAAGRPGGRVGSADDARMMRQKADDDAGKTR